MNNAQSASIIKYLCKKKSITVSSLLKDCQIRKSLIYDMEKRDKTPSAEIFEQIADYLDCSVDYLLGRTDVQTMESYIRTPNNTTDYIMTTNKSETILLIEYRSLNAQGQEYIMQTMDMVKDRYKKSASVSSMEVG